VLPQIYLGLVIRKHVYESLTGYGSTILGDYFVVVNNAWGYTPALAFAVGLQSSLRIPFSFPHIVFSSFN